MYAVKEIFKTLQGEGYHSGRSAVFCRFAGCNLWTGREEDRRLAVCKFCDTEFIGTDGKNGGKYATGPLVEKCAEIWGYDRKNRFVVLTGGEPLLQVDQFLVSCFHALDFEVAVESNGTIKAPAGIDWLTISPKAGSNLVQFIGNELKVVIPQDGLDPVSVLSNAPQWASFGRLYVQPMDGPSLAENTVMAIQFCLENPIWKLSLQTHKMIGIE